MGGRHNVWQPLRFMVLGWVVFALITLCMETGLAATLYVDKDTSCPGQGTSDDPYCAMQRAFEHVACGDRIRIRQAKTPYDESAVAQKPSCLATARIVVEPDTGHTPILRYTGKGSRDGVIELRNVDNWTVRQLTFDGKGVPTSDYAIEVHAQRRTMIGTRILGNTIRNWGLTPLSNRGTRSLFLHDNRDEGYTVNNALVRGNTLTNIRTNAMRIEGTQHAVIEHNTLSHLLCGWKNAKVFKHEAIKITAGKSRSRSMSNGTLVRQNHLSDFQSIQACQDEFGGKVPLPTFQGIYCDVNGDDGVITGNVIHTMSPNVKGDKLTRGIYIESGCDRWRVSENIVYNVAGVCYRISSDGYYVTLENNVCYNAGLGIDYRQHREVTIRHNIVYLTRRDARAIRIDRQAVSAPRTVNDNLYFNHNGRLTFTYNKGRVGFTMWQKRCGCDAQSKTADPQFVSTKPGRKDFHLRRESPARRAKNGAVHLGAYPRDGAAGGRP